LFFVFFFFFRGWLAGWLGEEAFQQLSLTPSIMKSLPCSFNCFRSPPSQLVQPIQHPPAITPTYTDLPEIPVYNLDGAFCRPLTWSSSSRPSTANRNNSRTQPSEAEIEEEEEEEEEEIQPTDKPVIQPRKQSVPLLYRKRAFPVPELDMVAGRTPGSAWQAVAAKVVSANRIRRGLGKETKIEDFRVQELGGRAGKSIFGPVSVFNGEWWNMGRKKDWLVG
jgi:hypothetical protein